MRLLVRQDLWESPTRGWYKHRVRCLRQETQRFQGSLQESRDNPKKSDRLQTCSGFTVFLTRSTPLFLPLIGFHRRGPVPNKTKRVSLLNRAEVPVRVLYQCLLSSRNTMYVHENAPATRCHHFSNSSTHTQPTYASVPERTGLVQEPTPASLSITTPRWGSTYHIYARYKDRLTCGAIHFPQNPSPRRLSRQISPC